MPLPQNKVRLKGQKFTALCIVNRLLFCAVPTEPTPPQPDGWAICGYYSVLSNFPSKVLVACNGYWDVS